MAWQSKNAREGTATGYLPDPLTLGDQTFEPMSLKSFGLRLRCR